MASGIVLRTFRTLGKCNDGLDVLAISKSDYSSDRIKKVLSIVFVNRPGRHVIVRHIVTAFF
ncbi:hypothetical protein MIDIC_360003 [Alphaproteobacteria bacterium]